MKQRGKGVELNSLWTLGEEWKVWGLSRSSFDIADLVDCWIASAERGYQRGGRRRGRGNLQKEFAVHLPFCSSMWIFLINQSQGPHSPGTALPLTILFHYSLPFHFQQISVQSDPSHPHQWHLTNQIIF